MQMLMFPKLVLVACEGKVCTRQLTLLASVTENPLGFCGRAVFENPQTKKCPQKVYKDKVLHSYQLT